MPKCGKDYEIRKNRSRDLLNTSITLNKNALIHIARQIDNPDSFADNLMTSIFRMLGMNFPKPFSEICLIISLWNPLVGSFCVIKEDLCILCGGSF